MDEPDFIVPPPGLIPPAPEAPERTEPERTVRAAPVRSFPAFTPPPGPAPVPIPPSVLPSAPPAHAAPRPGQPGGPVAVPSPPATDGAAAAPVRLTGVGGLDVAVDGELVLGRDPVTGAATPRARLVPVVDPARSVSKTHALVEPAGDHVRITDLHSTNGVRALLHGHETRELVPGVPTAIPVGATVLLGDFEVRVHEAPSDTV